MNRRLALLLALTLVLPAAATAAVLFGGDGVAASEEFQTLLGGLGQGPALDLTRCPHEFDPRLGVACTWSLEPVPGGSHVCPVHAGR